MSKKILIYIEKNNSVSDELAGKSQELALKLGDAEIIGFGFNLEHSNQTLFDKIYCINDERLENYSGMHYSKIAVDLIRELEPEIVLIGATTCGRDLAPQIASELHTGLTADCTALDINDSGKLEATRPTFGGKLMAVILSKNNPQMATVRPHVITTNFDVLLKNTEYIDFKPNCDDLKSNIKLVDVIKKDILSENIEDSEIIVGCGRGLKDNLDLVYKFAEKINAKVGVSRSLVDMGIASSDIQIGQTGKTICPKLYIAVGISGAIQHTVGIMGAKKIIAINSDKNASVFKLADVGIVGDAVEILSDLIKLL